MRRSSRRRSSRVLGKFLRGNFYEYDGIIYRKRYSDSDYHRRPRPIYRKLNKSELSRVRKAGVSITKVKKLPRN